MNTETLTSAQTATEVQTYTIDPAHSTIEFKVRHLGFSKVTGRFGTFTGTIHYAPGHFDSIEVDVTIDASSIDTRDESRDTHLRSGDFFDVEKHNELHYQSGGVKNGSDDSFTLAGDLTIRGVTRPIDLKVNYLGEADDPWGGKRIAFDARGKINRRDYGLTWNTVLESGGLLVGDDIEINLDVQAVLNT
ncbi:MAG TPA: YceI family protein [Rhodothermales bacterium]|nr:YceI family protein [Rhodothermales bacterium]